MIHHNYCKIQGFVEDCFIYKYIFFLNWYFTHASFSICRWTVPFLCARIQYRLAKGNQKAQQLYPKSKMRAVSFPLCLNFLVQRAHHDSWVLSISFLSLHTPPLKEMPILVSSSKATNAMLDLKNSICS